MEKILTLYAECFVWIFKLGMLISWLILVSFVVIFFIVVLLKRYN